ncbi:MAG: family 78 glycoside hydrolase catalytic domain [Clostridia bacterium]|nr:family 78 glycoside hydrolase catalytic domain [Clostridia bacterium]
MNTCPLHGSCWIGASAECESPVITRRFDAGEILSARLTVTGLGYYEAKLGGVPVTDELFLPVASDYEKRDFSKIKYPCHDSFTHRIYYGSYDVTALIRPGENELTVQLGNGWYRQSERIAEGEISFGDTLKAVYTLILTTPDGTVEIRSDGSETWRESEIVISNLFLGEIIDARRQNMPEYPVRILPAPDSILTEQMGTPDRVIRTIDPVCLCRDGERAIYDCGENISGLCALTSSAEAGTEIVLRFAENLTRDGALDFTTTGAHYKGKSGKNQIQSDTFITDGTARSFCPKFVWHAFRYFEVIGPHDSVCVRVIHADTPVTARFESASEGLNFLFDAFVRTQLNNMHGSYPSDCPHRERLGYTGDGQIAAEASMRILDSRAFYRKWIRDILDCQDTVGGHVQHTAPFMGGGGGPGGWGCAIVLVPWIYYRQYGRQNGETEILRECWEGMKHWIGYLCEHSENGLIVREEEGGWCLGDWCTLEKCVLPPAFVNTYYFVKSLGIMQKIARILGETEEIPRLQTLEEASRRAMRENWQDSESGHFFGGVQGADGYAADLGLDPAVTARLAAEKYDALGHFDTGFLGTDILLDALFENGYADTAFRLLDGEEKGSFLYMKRHGATTVWESWTGGSHDHPMFGGCARHLFSSILGIRQSEDSAGWERAVIDPRIPADLSFARGSMMTPRGEIAVDWRKEGTELHLTVTVPAGMEAHLRTGGTDEILPAGTTQKRIAI